MQQMTASRAKQNFGALLEAVSKGPVAIERHKSIKVIVCSPETFHATMEGYSSPGRALEDRRAARAAQQLVEKNRLIKHQKLAIDLLLMNGLDGFINAWRCVDVNSALEGSGSAS